MGGRIDDPDFLVHPAYAGVSGVSMNWQPIETAPKDGTEILAARQPRQFDWWIMDVVSYAWEDENGHWWQHDGNRAWQPTHWMPLPSPPEAP